MVRKYKLYKPTMELYKFNGNEDRIRGCCYSHMDNWDEVDKEYEDIKSLYLSMKQFSKKFCYFGRKGFRVEKDNVRYLRDCMYVLNKMNILPFKVEINADYNDCEWFTLMIDSRVCFRLNMPSDYGFNDMNKYHTFNLYKSNAEILSYMETLPPILIKFKDAYKKAMGILHPLSRAYKITSSLDDLDNSYSLIEYKENIIQEFKPKDEFERKFKLEFINFINSAIKNREKSDNKW